MTSLPPNITVEALETYITQYKGTSRLMPAPGDLGYIGQEYCVMPAEVCDRLLEMAKDAERLRLIEVNEKHAQGFGAALKGTK